MARSLLRLRPAHPSEALSTVLGKKVGINVYDWGSGCTAVYDFPTSPYGRVFELGVSTDEHENPQRAQSAFQREGASVTPITLGDSALLALPRLAKETRSTGKPVVGRMFDATPYSGWGLWASRCSVSLRLQSSEATIPDDKREEVLALLRSNIEGLCSYKH